MPQITSTNRSSKFAPGKSSNVATSTNKSSGSTNKIIGVLLAVLILVGLFRMLNTKPQVAEAPRLKVVAAAKDIHPGVRVGFADVRYMDIPVDYANKAMFKKTNQVVGRISTIFIPARNPIEDGYLHPKNKSLSSTLENHERALTIKLSEEGLVDHQLYPGDRVDVLVTMVKNGQKYTNTICKNVKVLMVSTRDMVQSNGANSRNQNRITLAVLPEQAELITHAEQSGTPKLLMRNRLATNMPKLGGVSEDDLLPESASSSNSQMASAALLTPPAPVQEPILSLPDLPPVPPEMQAIPQAVQKSVGWVVEVFTGSKKDTYEFPSAPAN